MAGWNWSPPTIREGGAARSANSRGLQVCRRASKKNRQIWLNGSQNDPGQRGGGTVTEEWRPFVVTANGHSWPYFPA